MKPITSALLLSAGALLLPSLSQSATFVPTKFTDSSGTCDLADCSLREAILAANATPGPDEIILDVGTYLLTSEVGGANGGDLDITDEVILQGVDFEQTVIQQTVFEERVLEITNAAGSVVLRDVALTGGDLSGISDDGGGIRSRSALTLERVRIFGNTAPKGAGGGVEISFAALEVRDSRIENNSAGAFPGISGGDASVTVVDTVFSSNIATVGAALSWGFGDLQVSGSTFVANSTAGLDYNAASDDAGTVVNSTFSGNSTGIFFAGNGALELKHLTIVVGTGNDALFIQGAGATLFASAIDGPCIGLEEVTSLGENVEAGSGCFTPVASDLTNVGSSALALGPLRDNGGLTDTHAILGFTSPLVSEQLRGCATPRDQRGLLRSYCDRGAYELPVCFEPASPIAIPDNDPTGINVEISGSLFAGDDVDVFLEIEHTYVGDLVVTLNGPGGSVDLVDRPGPGTLGCSGNDLRTIFDDQATLAGDDCRDVTALEAFPRARYQATTPLAIFEGAVGAWHLEVSDHESSDVGQLVRVCLMTAQTLLFGDDFEAGNTDSWSSTSP